MADSAASVGTRGPLAAKRADRSATSGSITATAAAPSNELLARYEAFSAEAIHAPAQSGLWVKHWISQVHPDGILAMLLANQRPVLALALEVVRLGPFRIARFMGGGHANGNFPAVDRNWLETADPVQIQPLLDAIAEARPDVDVVALQRLLPDLEGKANPLGQLPGVASPNISLAVDLKGGFNEVLCRINGRRKSKKHRAQTRKFEAAGGFRRYEARTSDQVRVLLDAFFDMKEQRFRKMGIANVFSGPEIRGFFHALFADALKEKEPPFVLHGLEVTGKLRAVSGSSLSGRRLICEFAAIAEDELSQHSPGEYLFYENIQEACANALEVYDFSVGDEPYKRNWCNLETQHRDVMLPLTHKGRLLVWCLIGRARLTGWVKARPAIWNLVRRIRRIAGKSTVLTKRG